MDDCELSFVAGRLRVDFFRQGKLVQSRVLDIEAVENLAEKLDKLDELPQLELDGGVVLERAYARNVSRQLRTLASVLRIARELWSEVDMAQSNAPPMRPSQTPSRASSIDGRARRFRIVGGKRSS